MRLKLVPDNTNFDFFGYAKITFGASVVAIILSLIAWGVMGLNFGIDFRGGTTLRTEATEAVDVGAYRDALSVLELGDVTISEVFDPGFRDDQHVAMIRVQAQEGQEAATTDTIQTIQTALQEVSPDIKFTSVESVGPKVSGELIQTAFLAVGGALAAILIYIWLRFEWQFSVGAVVALFHDVVLTIGLFSLLQIRFDLPVVAAILTIIGYLALIALLILGGDVIRAFVFAITWGVIVGTYSSVYVAKNVVLFLGVKRDWSKPDAGAGTQFANIDA